MGPMQGVHPKVSGSFLLAATAGGQATEAGMERPKDAVGQGSQSISH